MLEGAGVAGRAPVRQPGAGAAERGLAAQTAARHRRRRRHLAVGAGGGAVGAALVPELKRGAGLRRTRARPVGFDSELYRQADGGVRVANGAPAPRRAG
eukprot:SAG11_NODE_1320_length_5208_cov_5.188687_2_plen_99_part_00